MNKNIPKPPPVGAGKTEELNSVETISNDQLQTEKVPEPIKENKEKPSKKLLFIIVGALLGILILGAGAFFVVSKLKKSSGGNVGGYSNVVSKNNDSGERNSIIGGGVHNSKCEEGYKKLLEVNGFDFDRYCINQKIRTGSYDENAVPQKKKNLVLIFDASGSMAAKINGKRKIDIAKDAAKKFIDQVANEEGFALSIVVYGHKGSNAQSQKKISCNGIEEVYYLGNVDAEIAKSKLDKFDATGWTPIANSFKKAEAILSKYSNDENFILLVSDGKEMCDGDPVTTIKEIKSKGLNVKADVIGFDVGGADESQLKAIAQAGDGDYFSVSSAVDLENAFAKHKEMLNKADFKIGRTIEQLYDISFVINTYNQCRVMLQKEQVAMMLDIHASKLIGKKCENFADGQYKKRFNELSKKIETTYKNDKAKFDALK